MEQAAERHSLGRKWQLEESVVLPRPIIADFGSYTMHFGIQKV